jgi:hypothetical protein
MAIPEFVTQKLRQIFGAEATEVIVTWMDDIERQRGDVVELRQDVRADIAELRHEMQVGFARLEAKIDQSAAQVEARFERRFSDLMKWSFVFWVSAVASIAMMAKVLP